MFRIMKKVISEKKVDFNFYKKSYRLQKLNIFGLRKVVNEKMYSKWKMFRIMKIDSLNP